MRDRTPGWTWVILILVAWLFPLQSMAAQTQGGVPYVVDIRGAPAEPYLVWTHREAAVSV